MAYEHEEVYISKKSGCSGLWEIRDRNSDMQVSLHDSEQEAINSAVANGYLVS